MIAPRLGMEHALAEPRRPGVAAVEFAVCLPLLLTLLLGLWEVGRMVEVQQVACNGAREAARDASLATYDLQTVANHLVSYLQSAEPTAFGSGHSTSLTSPVISMAANTYGYTCWDNTANRELFTMTFTDYTNTSVTGPTGMSQLDHYRISISYPFASVGWLPVSWVTNTNRLTASVDWACMVDSPFSIAPDLPAQ